MRALLLLLLVLGLAAPVGAQDIPTDPDELRLALTRWISHTHQNTDYPSDEARMGGALLGMTLIAELEELLGDGPVDPPPPDDEFPDATWRGEIVDGRLQATRLADGRTFDLTSCYYWLGADRHSTAARDVQPVNGKVPGDVLVLGPGLLPNFRWTLTYDVDVEAVKQNPVRLGDPKKSPDRWFTYWLEDGGIQYGVRKNRDAMKGLWTKPTAATELEPAYPSWFEWGIDPQTWIIGSVGADGYPTTVIGGGRTYGEWIGAASFANLVFRGPTGNGSAAIWQVENPLAYDANGGRLDLNWPDDPRAVSGEWQGFRDVELWNCWIEGEWDFTVPKDQGGLRSKWGVLTYELGRSARGDDVPGFRWIEGGIGGIAIEHCFYFHNTRANTPDAWAVHLKGLELGPSGRTAVQSANRSNEGPGGQGRFVIEDCTVRDVCLESGGGGSAFSFNGRYDGVIEILRCDVRLGANPDLDPHYQGNITGGFVSHAGGGSEGEANREIVIEGCHFQVGPHFLGKGAARRPNLQVRNVGTFRLRATSVHQYDGAREAISFGPDSIGALELDPHCDVRGNVRWGDVQWADRDDDGDGLDDGHGWAGFIGELRDGVDTNGDGVVTTAGSVAVSWN